MGNVTDTKAKPNPSFSNAAEIVPNDDENLEVPTEQIYIGSSEGGTLHVVTVNGQDITFTGTYTGLILNLRVAKVMEDSTAENLIAIW